jgi:hypothetical protein
MAQHLIAPITLITINSLLNSMHRYWVLQLGKQWLSTMAIV